MDSFFGIGMMELFFIALIALIVLGPERMPGAIREVMKTIRYVRNLSNELTSQFSEEFKDLEDLSPQKIMKDIAGDLDEEDAPKKAAAAKPLAAKTAAKPAGVKPAAAKPAAKPATAVKPPAKAAEGKIADKKPAENKPAENKPAVTEAADTKADDVKSSAAKSSDVKTDETADGAAAPAEQTTLTTQEPDTSVAASKPAPPKETAAMGDGEAQPENTILPPQTKTDEASPPAAELGEAAGDLDGAQSPKAEAASAAEPPAVAEGATDDNAVADLEPAPAVKRAALSVNGKGADPEGEG
jgi:Tat protein translocase TatB subunit